MKRNVLILLFLVVIISVVEGLLSSSCKKQYEVCRDVDSCCPVTGRRMVCAAYLEKCGKTKCCITEVEEQQEKQAAIIRDRNGKLKRILKLLLNDDD